MGRTTNERGAVDAGHAPRWHSARHRPGATDSGCWGNRGASVANSRQIYMNAKCIVLLGSALLLNGLFAETVYVPGRANPWLAGMTNGSAGRRGDGAPEESP